MLSPISSKFIISGGQNVQVSGQSSPIETQLCYQESQHQYMQIANQKAQHQFLNQTEYSKYSNDIKLTVNNISETLIHIFSQFVDHLETNKTDYKEIKNQWVTFKQFLYPINQQKVNDYFLNGQKRPIQSLPISTRNDISLANMDIQNSQEAIVSLNEIMMQQQDLNRRTNSITTNIFNNNFQSPSVPSLLPSSTFPSSTNIYQQLQKNTSCQQNEYSSSILNITQGVQNEDNSNICTLVNVSRCNSFTSPSQPIISTCDTNNASQSNNNQYFSSIKKDSTPNSPLLLQQNSLSSRSKKESSFSQFKAVPISTFKLDAQRINKHHPQLSLNINQGISQLNTIDPDLKIVSPLNTQYQNKRGSSQSKKRFQSPTNIQQHQVFLQSQRESLVRQVSKSQDRQSLQKIINDNKQQAIAQLVNEYESKDNTIYLQGAINRSNTQHISKQLERREQQQLVVLPPQIQNVKNNISSSTNTPPNQIENQNNRLSLNISISQKNSPYSSSSTNVSKPLPGPTIASNNQSSYKQQLSSSSNKSNPQSPQLVSNDHHNLLNKQTSLSKKSSFCKQGSLRLSKQGSLCKQDSLSTEESCKENDKNSYFFPKEDEQNQKDLSDLNRQSENYKSIQSNGKSFVKVSQNKVISLNSYQVASQYGTKQNLENCVSPTKLQQNSKSLNKSKNIFQNSQGMISIQNTNQKQNTESTKNARLKTEGDYKNKTNTVEQLLQSQNSSDQMYEIQSLSQNNRTQSKHSVRGSSMISISINTNFQNNSLKQKVSNLLSLFDENNSILKTFTF